MMETIFLKGKENIEKKDKIKLYFIISFKNNNILAMCLVSAMIIMIEMALY